MAFKRKIYDRLLEWKQLSAGKSAILIEGARRVGKSTIVEEFAKREYEDYMILDFAKEGKEIRQNFEENIGNMDVFFQNLFLLKGKSLPRRKAVVIFDEVQLFPRARQAIKYLVADGRYDYIETGSLISIKQNVRDILIPSEEYKLKMFPMDFEEFLWALGDTVTVPAIRAAFENKRALGDSIHRKIMQKFRTYMAVGGMPQAVALYAAGETYERIDFIKRTILTLYEDDLKKNDEDNREKASVIFQTIPEQLAHHNSHFKMSLIDKNARYKHYVESIHFIAESMIGNECINVTEPSIMPEARADRMNFKLYMGDTGLLVTQMMKNASEPGTDLYKSLIFDKLGVNQGMILENVVAQMLRANGHLLYFHEYMYQSEGAKKEKKYEVDFLTLRGKKLCPLEVKSSAYRSHKSLDNLSRKYDVKWGAKYVVYSKDFRQEGGVTYLPFYMAICI